MKTSGTSIDVIKKLFLYIKIPKSDYENKTL